MSAQETRSLTPPLLDALREERIEAHLRFLSHPLLEGRGVGTRGGRLAEEYVRATLRAAGLGPAPGVGHRQEVPMIGMLPAPSLAFEAGDDEIMPGYGDEFVLEAGRPEELVQVEAPLIFAGYGIHAPEYGWDDYGDLDVAGKILLVRVNDPGTPDQPDFFEGGRLTYYGRWTYKFEEAARRGAAGVLLIHTDESAGYGWNVVRTSNTGEQYQLAGIPEFPLGIRGWLTEEVGRALLSAGGAEAEQLLRQSDQPGFRARALPVIARAEVRSEIREVRTANVLGVVPGTDDALDGEPIVVMAHHDHLGVSTGAGDEPVVYAGAIDNASGVALILAIAEGFAESKTRLRRPVLFLASTAEESGLLGSEWYVRHPIWPLGRTVAVLNVDGANLQGPTDDIAPLGVDRSTLGDLVRAAAEAEGLELRPEQHPEKGSFFRQDHFPFARAGVPGIAFDHGLRYRDRPEGWGERWYEEYIAKHYHQPSDAFREDFDYRGAVQQGRLMLRTLVAAAEADSLPEWTQGSAFGLHRP
ncbi:MAG: M28 family peptidase [Gemmatimonadota bacterium]